jgi:protein SCO1/2
LFSAILISCASRLDNSAQLPFYSDASFTPYWEDQIDFESGFHKLEEFSLLDQSGSEFGLDDMAGRISVVDFFFTSCPGICPQMTSNLHEVNKAFEDDPEVQIVCHSVTPQKDSVQVLQRYAELNGINSTKWKLLTGDRDVIYQLGRQTYFIEEDLGEDVAIDQFIHTENFVLIDQKGYLRGIYNGLDVADVQQLIADIRYLQSS